MTEFCTDYSYRTQTEKLRDRQILPNIPITPIGYEDAAKLLKQLGGMRAPMDWQGTAPGIDTYYIGPLKNG